MSDALLTHLLTIAAQVGDPISMGISAEGERRMISILGGSVRGRLQGRILPGGADWQVVRTDGIADIGARYVIETDGGARIEVRSEGYRHGPPEVMARLARGDKVDRGEYYFRTLMRFATGDQELAWLNGMLGLAVGERLSHEVRLEVYEVL